MASLIEQGESITLDPFEGFVVKTKIVDAEDLEAHQLKTKVFINICYDEQVPKPGQEFDASVVFPMIISNQWEIPIITSQEKTNKDKKGVPSLVYDCCINKDCFTWCQLNSDLKSILIEWCIEAVEILYDITLEREYTLPKMISKGELSKTEILKSEIEGKDMEKELKNMKDERLGLIEELKFGKDEDNDNNEGKFEQLPNIMDLKGNKKGKILIEEIEMDHKEKDGVNKNSSTLQPQVQPQINSSRIQILDEEELGLKEIKTMKLDDKIEKKVVVDSNSSNSIQSSSYEIIKSDEGLVIKIHLPNFQTDTKRWEGTGEIARTDLSISYNKSTKKLLLESGDINTLSITLTENISSLKTFWIEKEMTLYVFARNC
ncbi:protein interacting with Hsp90 1 [[Candida] anglica]|uniref:Protein interacting with Hsp90 1 n=1 Tax=[Candida] anglica TaxID=148631 RepID=A0ABP0EGI7_9ASCO